MIRFTRFTILLGAAAAASILFAGGALGMTYTAPGVVGIYTPTDSPVDLAVNNEGDLWVSYPQASPPRIARLDILGRQQVSVPITTFDAIPNGIATDAAGNAYVTDQNLGTVSVFSKSGSLLRSFSTGYIPDPQGIAVSPSGTIYVVTANDSDISVFDANGNPQGAIGDNILASPNGVALDSSGNVWVADTENDRIVEFSSSGAQIRTIGSEGAANGQFEVPINIAVGPGDNVFVSDENNHREQEFSSSGQFVNAWGTGGDGPGQFTENLGVAADIAGNVYVADNGDGRIEKFYLGPNACTKVDRKHIAACNAAKSKCLHSASPTTEVSCTAKVTAAYKRYRTK